MTAKRDLIKNLNKEVRDLKRHCLDLQKTIEYRDLEIKRHKEHYEADVRYLRSQIESYTDYLRDSFTKELTWMELCDDPDYKFQAIKKTISGLLSLSKVNL